ncbi:DHA2 family efflux MFS transporter permease subunit [Micropruina sonneratiae]|uniref:DHA2 family efflux MFS transporter permease subunit n=1 Tax=Micropruina sonneratiae TaxID=2986940 RepID=UPI002226F9CB|nr:DHA2 family efflux MFS transporter permease subunit [Micropruina sp. KQZ13P-5]MCW3156406.1 DHA2 family efflux MFS transporter permease subunit [Micropruina sp. KQZ13P-5]
MTDQPTTGTTPAHATAASAPHSPWPALWAVIVGFFMLLVDTTIVSVANPAIKTALDPDTGNLDNVVWVTSAYLLAFAVPLLISGRLGDAFGPKRVYLTGLAVFTLASLGCGLSTSLGMLVAMRAVQGLGAALMSPQSMALITRTFPADRRGAAMGLWGATAGVATLVGPLAGGALVDAFGWEAIFFVNLPVGVAGFVLAWFLVPALETHRHRFDMVGVLLSAVGLFLLVFGLQEGEAYDWGVIWGPVSVWSLIVAGLLVLGLFAWQQSRTASEPLVPLALFADRNFSLSNLAIATVGASVTAMALPMMFFLQLARGLTPTDAALLTIPTAVLSGVLSPLAGRLLDRTDPRVLLLPGMLLFGGGLLWYSTLMRADTALPLFLLPAALVGIGSAGVWGPLATTATRNLPPRQAGAGSGIYNTTRTIGSVIGSAAIAAVMQARLEANLPGGSADAGFGSGQLPSFLVDGFSAAMSQAMLLPVATITLGTIVVLFVRRWRATTPAPRRAVDEPAAR